MGWFEFAAAFAAFFLSHAVPLRPPVRPWLQVRLGSAGFTLAYSLMSLAVLAWLIGAAGRAPHVPLVVMLPVCLILTLSIARPNPFSFGGARNARFDPARPGVVRWTRHPLLLALALWAGAHVMPNGDIAHVILFGVFAGFAVLGMRLIDGRKQREMGAGWQHLRARTAAAPRIAWPSAAGVMRGVAGVALYVGLIALHPVLFGVSPLP